MSLSIEDLIALKVALLSGNMSRVDSLIDKSNDLPGILFDCFGYAMENKYLPAVKHLFSTYAKNDQKYWLNWCLQVASRDGHANVVEYLIDVGAIDDFRNCLYLAMLPKPAHLEVAKILIQTKTSLLDSDYLLDTEVCSLAEIGLPLAAFSNSPNYAALAQSILNFKVQVKICSNHVLIPEMSCLISEYSLK